MTENFNYKVLFNQALQRIKCIRDPHATRPENSDLKWDIVERQKLFNFGGDRFRNYAHVIDSTKKISVSCLNAIIMYLSKHYKSPFELVSSNPLMENQSEIYFTIKDTKTNTLLFFKEIEECSVWKIKGGEPTGINEFINKQGASSCKYIYLVYDYAYLQIVGHNEDGSDPGRGYNLYSIKWFFETYFGIAEYERFYSAINEYNQAVENYLGYIFVKSLTPNALISFRKVTENIIVKYPYELLLQKTLTKKFGLYDLPEADYEIIKTQYLQDGKFLMAIGNNDFAESFITAEWLFHSMKKARAIDLTIIGMGYLKAVEQLLFDLICLHKTENRTIRKDQLGKNLSLKLNEESISNDVINFTLGSMAYFFKDNMDMLRDELSKAAKDYIKETIFDFSDLRNGYFHKHNIHRVEKIEDIRRASFYMVFLLLGSHKLTDAETKQLGMPDMTAFCDFSRLCEYVNYHAGEIFFLNLGVGREEQIFSGSCDLYSKVVDDSYVEYSGVYFKELSKDGRTFKFSKDDLPEQIYLGKFVYAQTELLDIQAVKVAKVFEDGRFVGSSIVEEENLDY